MAFNKKVSNQLIARFLVPNYTDIRSTIEFEYGSVVWWFWVSKKHKYLVIRLILIKVVIILIPLLNRIFGFEFWWYFLYKYAINKKESFWIQKSW